MTETEPITIEAPPEKQSLDFGPRVIKKTIPWGGNDIELHYYQPTRFMRNSAMTEAVDEYRRLHPGASDDDMGADPAVLEKGLVLRMIKWWSIPKPPRDAWEWLPVDLGDLIVEALEINALFVVEAEDDGNGNVKPKLTKEVEAAKN